MVYVFLMITLMSVAREGGTPEHINALNLVSGVFRHSERLMVALWGQQWNRDRGTQSLFLWNCLVHLKGLLMHDVVCIVKPFLFTCLFSSIHIF